jgi:hypothetical protein
MTSRRASAATTALRDSTARPPNSIPRPRTAPLHTADQDAATAGADVVLLCDAIGASHSG